MEIIESIKNGADEIDIVINRGFVLQNNWKKLYEEVADFKKAAKNKHIKANVSLSHIGDIVSETVEKTKIVMKDEFPILIDTNFKDKHIVDFLQILVLIPLLIYCVFQVCYLLLYSLHN